MHEVAWQQQMKRPLNIAPRATRRTRAPWRRQTCRDIACGHNLRKRFRNVTGRPFRARVADRKTCRWRANIAGEGRRVRPQARSGKGREGAGRLVDIKNAPNWIQWPRGPVWTSTRSRSARLLMQNLRKRMARPGRDGCAGACRGLWRLRMSWSSAAQTPLRGAERRPARASSVHELTASPRGTGVATRPVGSS